MRGFKKGKGRGVIFSPDTTYPEQTTLGFLLLFLSVRVPHSAGENSNLLSTCCGPSPLLGCYRYYVSSSRSPG